MVLYCSITTILHVDALLPYLVNAGTDSIALLALSIIALLIGKPLAALDCQYLDSGSVSMGTARRDAIAALGKDRSRYIVYVDWISAGKSVCYESKAIWGLGLGLW